MGSDWDEIKKLAADFQNVQLKTDLLRFGMFFSTSTF